MPNDLPPLPPVNGAERIEALEKALAAAQDRIRLFEERQAAPADQAAADKKYAEILDELTRLKKAHQQAPVPEAGPKPAPKKKRNEWIPWDE